MNQNNHEKLDAYEQELVDVIETQGLPPSKLDADRQKMLQAAAQKKLDTLDAKKQISLKIRESDLELIRQKAKEVSIPYQNIIQALLHKYATGQIKLEI